MYVEETNLSSIASCDVHLFIYIFSLFYIIILMYTQHVTSLHA